VKTPFCKRLHGSGIYIAPANAKGRITLMAGSQSVGDPCEAMAHHGFNGLAAKP
jgi:hypothetical protein